MGYDNKYGRVTTERGDIAENEPVVVFRAQDKLLPEVLRVYRERCAYAGSPDTHLSLIDNTIADVEGWQVDHFTKVPESAGYQPE